MEGILNYKTPSIGTSATSAGAVNLCRDLSLINRKNHEHTTRKGVPLVYHTKVTVYRTGSTDVDETQELRFRCVPKNWVYRNAAVKLHAAREAMMKKNGITKKERGRYDHTIRYGWDNTDSSEGASSGWLSPCDENYDAFSSDKLGTWDTTELHLSNGSEIRPTLWGGIADGLEDTHVAAAGNRSLALMYLQSRQLIRQDDGDDTDIEGDGAESEFPAEFSVIRDLFNVAIDSSDEVRESVATSQDNPPYDTDDISTTASFVEIIEVGKSQCGLQSFVKDTLYLDVPFGIMDIKGIVNQGSARAIKLQIEVLGVSEMQG
jgi:hypothetical protein